MRDRSFASASTPRWQQPGVLGIAAGWLLMNAVLLWMYFHQRPKTLIGDETMYNAAALLALQGGDIPLHYIWPPGQKWFLTALHAILGEGMLGILLLQTGLLAICGWMLYRLWCRLDRPAAALWATALFLVNPGVLAYAHWVWPEVPHLACLMGALILLVDRDDHPIGVGRALGAGALVGIALLFKSLLAAFWPLLVLLLLVRWQRWRPHPAWKAMAAFVLGLFVVTAPALWQGWRDTGRPMIADSSIYNLYVGLIDLHRSDYVSEYGMTTLTPFLESGATPQARNAIYSEKIAALVAERGVVAVFAEQMGRQYFRLFNAKTLLVSQLPGPACAGQLGAYADSAVATPMRWVTQLFHGLVLALAAFGIACWRRWRDPLLLCIVAFFGYQLALYLGLHVMQRYLFPFLPFLCGFAGSALAGLGSPDGAVVANRWRLLAGALLALVLLGLAWLGPLLDGPTCPA